MLIAENKTIKMDYKDYGIGLPISIVNYEILPTDELKLIIKENEYGDEIVSKPYTDLVYENNKVDFVLSFEKEESELLKPKYYVYEIEHYRNGEFLNTILDGEKFIVKVGK